MRLTVGNKQIALPVDTSISIERSTPLLNDDTGSFSFPFAVPTLPNQQNLGWPGKLQRSGDIPDQSFILEDSGLQVFRGEVDYDDVTANEIGLILKSGFSEFTKKMEGKKLCDIDYGGESWPVTNSDIVDMPKINAKLLEWDMANTTDNGKYVLSPFWIRMTYSTTSLLNVNRQFWNNTEPSWLHISESTGDMQGHFCLQFRVCFVLRKIFESAGYAITEDSLSLSEFNKVIFYTNVISIHHRHIGGGVYKLFPVLESLQYSTLMPDIEVLSFLSFIKDLLCMMYEIDELKKEVRIKFKKDIFLTENLDGMKIAELAEWTHKEEKALKGFALRYISQDSDQDTKYDYEITATVDRILPSPAIEGDIYRVTPFMRDYIAVKNDSGDLEWQEIGRLKEYREGDGENTADLNVKIPVQKQYSVLTPTEKILECPALLNITREWKANLTIISFLAITLYHGRKMLSGVNYPYASFDRFSVDGTIDTGISLKPAYLYNTVYSEMLNWQTYRARPFTKYLALSLTQLIALQWGKRYMINGVVVIFDKLNYELPYSGQIEATGYTA
jgi:hypothetical protein